MHLKLDKTLSSWERRLLVYRPLESTLLFPTTRIELARLATTYKSQDIWRVPLLVFDLISIACLFLQAKRRIWLINGEPLPEQFSEDETYYHQFYEKLREGLRLDDGLLAITSDPVLQELVDRRMSLVDLVACHTANRDVERFIIKADKEALVEKIEMLRAHHWVVCETLLKMIIEIDYVICEHLNWPLINCIGRKELQNSYNFAAWPDDPPPPRPLAMAI
jgi:hypothetical protein